MATSRSDVRRPSLRKDGSSRARPFRRVLVANRGEIAVRIMRACREMGIETVAVYSDADAGAGHVRAADVAVRIGPPPARDSYLRIDAVVGAARDAGADAVHPGYGFLAESASLASAVDEAGIAFVGPSAATIRALGDKLQARRLARSVGVPVVPGTLEAAAVRPDRLEDLLVQADAVGFPLLVKAAAGGGGRGMRRVARREELAQALADGAHEADAAFGDGAVYLERELTAARHVEVQLLGDLTGRVVALGERDCSLQRRHQKLVEEAPAPGLTRDQRVSMHDAAVRLAEAAGLQNAATAEFLVAPDGAFHFLEVNTRLQVEHGVTELVSGLDIVREQLFLAAGRSLSEEAVRAAEEAAEPRGHAIEVRLSAEDPGRGFAPTPGRVRRWLMPSGPGVRVDTAIEAGDRVPAEYDNLIAKVLVHAGTRDHTIDRLRRALDETEIAGIQTTLPFHRFVARDDSFRRAELSTTWVSERWDGPGAVDAAMTVAALAAGVAALDAGRPALADAPKATGGQAPPADRDGRWHRAGLEEAVDRWPR